MMVKPGCRRATTILLLAPARQCREHDGLKAWFLPHSAGHLVSVHAGHSDIEKYHVGLFEKVLLKTVRALFG